ncbi:MAG: type II toxin-antitoxin system VapC family toxin [Oscillospiraceae bacterium]|nr:type II toxin-antitoxin system VapC family toxin [Oscillospiraceae bacterium]
MKYLLDTHTALWSLYDKQKLSGKAKSIISNISFPLYISIVSAWEIAIKLNIGKLNLTGGSSYFLEKMNENGVRLLGLESSYIKQVEDLPLIHRDPFDRLLIATAIVENMTILTADENIHQYNIPYIW